MPAESLGVRVVEHSQIRKEIQVPQKDIGLIWILSAPGTPLLAPTEGIFAGRQLNRERIERGVELAREVTALKLSKPVAELTQEDLEHAPILYYNGESAANRTTNPKAEFQNEDFQTYISRNEFPLNTSRVVVDPLEEIFTPGQIKGLVRYVENNLSINKVAVVTHSTHMVRVGRYIEKYKNLFPNTEFVAYPVCESEVLYGSLKGEIKRIKDYSAKGDLAEKSIFSQE